MVGNKTSGVVGPCLVLVVGSNGAGFDYGGQLFNFGGGHFLSVYVTFPS